MPACDDNSVRRLLRPSGRCAMAVVVCMCLLAPVRSTSGHGGKSAARIDQKVVIAMDGEGISLTYTTEFNRPAAFGEVVKMDLNGDGQLAPAEQAKYFDELHDLLCAGLEMNINGREAALPRVGDMELAMPFRKSLRFNVPQRLDREHEVTVEFHNDNYLDYVGDIEVTVDPGTDTDIVFDSRWQTNASESAEPSAPNGPGLSWRQRDVVFRYKRGTGIADPPDDFQAAVEEEAQREDELLASPTTSFPSTGMILLLALLAVAIVASTTRRNRYRKTTIALCGAAIGLVWWYTGGPWTSPPQVANPPDLQAAQLFQQLHGKIYRAFEATGESDIYDTLAEGLGGRLLDEVYNEVYEATVARRGQASRFDIRRVKPLETVILPEGGAAGGAFSVRFRWRVYGVVTHFGHTHARINEYEAEYLVQHNGQAWRITQSKVRQNKRVTMGKA